MVSNRSVDGSNSRERSQWFYSGPWDRRTSRIWPAETLRPIARGLSSRSLRSSCGGTSRKEEEGHRGRGEKGAPRRAPFSRARRGMAKKRGDPVTSRDSRGGAASLSLGRRRSTRSVHLALVGSIRFISVRRDLSTFALSKTRKRKTEKKEKKVETVPARRDGHIRVRTEVLNGNDNCAIAR